MAITANTVYEFQTGGDDTFGGGFDVTIANHGTDWSTATSAHAILTTISVVAATTTDITVNVADYTVATTDIGNIFYNVGGSSTTGFYQIVSVNTGTNTWTMDRSVGTAAQTVAGKMGGCRKLISSNSFAAALVPGNIVYIKAGSYAPGSYASQTAGTALLPIQILGYNSTRGDAPTGASRPALTLTTTTTVTINSHTFFRHIDLSGAGTSVLNMGSGGSTGNGTFVENCKITSTNATGTSAAVNGGISGRFTNNEVIAASCIGFVSNNTGLFTFGNTIHGCLVGIKVTVAGGSFISTNLVYGCTTALQMTTSGMTQIHVVSNTFFGAETPAGTGIDGSTATAPQFCTFLNNIIYGFTTGVNWQASQPSNWWDYNTFFNNTTDRTNVTAGPHDVAINPGFTNSGTGDFSITGAI